MPRRVHGLLAILVLSTLAWPQDAVAKEEPHALYRVGAASIDISPTAAEIATHKFFLGGYGFGNGQVAGQQTPVVSPRFATGVMSVGRPHARAIAIGDGKNTIVLVELDNQGTFAGLKTNYSTGTPRPWGLDDMRREGAAETGLQIKDITISSDHSHAGQDLTGVWGFVPDDYLRDVLFPGVVAAIKNAVGSMEPARLFEAAINTPSPCDGLNDNILNNQFDCTDVSPIPGHDDLLHNQNTVDTEIRVMQAVAQKDHRVIVTVTNFAAHATVGGSSNTLVSADWPGFTADQLSATYGGVGITLVADVGRSQPNRQDCTPDELKAALANSNPAALQADPANASTSCSMSKYGLGVTSYARSALAYRATEVGPGGVASTTFFIREPGSAGLLFGPQYAGDPAGIPIARQNLPPYTEGTVIGTWVSAYRIGSVLITTNPGEAYPNIRYQVQAEVAGPSRYWTVGLANDQLGYLIAPTPDAYQAAIFHGFGLPNNPAPIANDNYFFNASHSIGDHVACTQVKLAGQLGFAAPSTPVGDCALFAGEVNTAGADGSPPPA